MQPPCDVAVVIQTILRPSLLRAVRSVFDQDLSGRIQVLIGIDTHQGECAQLDTISQECPDNIVLTLFDPGYSTSLRHGGIYNNYYGGALRTILSYTANSRYVAYLDDDDWWGREHLSSLLAAIPGKDWAFSRRWLVDPQTGWPICHDQWDSVGPGAGINCERLGGYVAPSCLLVDKANCHLVLPFWSLSPCENGCGEDRLVFTQLLKKSWAATGKYTSYYSMPVETQKHPHHAREFGLRHIGWIKDRTRIEEIGRLLQKAHARLEAGDPDGAALYCRRALALNSHHVRALHLLSLTFVRKENFPEAFTSISHALEVDERDAESIALLAKISAALPSSDV
ncbi:MAG: hypothetical protein ACP5IL_09100 [Syntrophobacteraceae bacterium]